MWLEYPNQHCLRSNSEKLCRNLHQRHCTRASCSRNGQMMFAHFYLQIRGFEAQWVAQNQSGDTRYNNLDACIADSQCNDGRLWTFCNRHPSPRLTNELPMRVQDPQPVLSADSRSKKIVVVDVGALEARYRLCRHFGNLKQQIQNVCSILSIMRSYPAGAGWSATPTRWPEA